MRAAFSVQPDTESYTGSNMLLGKGSYYYTMTHQKLNIKRSNEAKLVGVVNVLPILLWKIYFLEAQGGKFYGSDIFQYNQSEISLEKNGRTPISKRTWNINIRFFVDDQVKAVEVSTKHCQEYDMVGDYFNKPL